MGIAETNPPAKLANAEAKNDARHEGVADPRDSAVRKEVMDAFAVNDVWGVGDATAKMLTGLGVHTAGALRDMPMKQARISAALPASLDAPSQTASSTHTASVG